MTGEATGVSRRFVPMSELRPLEPEVDDLVFPLLPLVPQCERRDGDYLAPGHVVA